MIEEVTVENELAASVTSRLGDMVKNSSVPSQQIEALELFGSFARTRQYAKLGRRELETLATQDIIEDIDIRIRAAEILYRVSTDKSEEQLQAFHAFLNLGQRPDLTPDQTVQVALALYECGRKGLVGRLKAPQMLLKLLRKTDLTPDQTVQGARALCECSNKGTAEYRWGAHILNETLGSGFRMGKYPA